MLLVVAFAVGAIVSAMLQTYLGIHTIWLAIILLGAINITYSINLHRKYQETRQFRSWW